MCTNSEGFVQYIIVMNDSGLSFSFETLTDLYNQVIKARMLSGRYKIYKVQEILG